jgi:acetoin utilization deacetylase AcuC-like enzyme
VTAAPSVALISNSDCGRHDTGWGHPEHVGRLRAVTTALRQRPDLFAAVRHVEGRHATPEELALVHDPAYVALVREMAVAGGGHLDADTPVSAGSWVAATAVVGSALDGVDLAFGGETVRSFCAVRPPGHHAVRGRGMGFCLFGGVAVAAYYARVRHAAERVLVVDWDVHHGNGTQALVERERGVRFVSLHQWPWYPGTGAAEDRGPHRTVWNVPMPAGLPAQRYVDALRRAVDDATADWAPNLVLVSAGFDSLRGDPLGGFTLEMEHVDHLTRWLVEAARSWCGGRLVSVLEGGYNVQRVGEACVVHLDALR